MEKWNNIKSSFKPVRMNFYAAIHVFDMPFTTSETQGYKKELIYWQAV